MVSLPISREPLDRLSGPKTQERHSDRREDGNPSLLGIDVIGVDEREGPAGAVLDLASDDRPYLDDIGRHLVVWQNTGALQLFDQFSGDVEVLDKAW